MAKRKISLGEGGIKGLFANHIEKLLFGIVVGVAGLLVWSGFSNREGIDTTKTPVKLKEEVTRATSHVESFRWNNHYRDKRSPKKTTDLTARAAETLEKMDEDSYALQQIMKPPVSTPRQKRTDPKMLVVTDLQAQTGYGALVKSSFSGAARDGGEEDILGGDDDGRDAIQDLDPDVFRPIPNGFGVAGGRAGSSGRGGRGGRNSSDAGTGVYFVTVTGLVPYREQLKQYQSSFLNGSSFDAGRDQPTYVFWKLQRSPVVEGSDKRQWKTITSSTARKTEQRLGTADRSGGMGESPGGIDPRAEDPVLTRPGPPLIARNLDRLYRHDRILTLEEALERMEKEREAEDASQSPKETDKPSEGSDDSIDIDPSLIGASSSRRQSGRRGGDDEGEMAVARQRPGGFEPGPDRMREGRGGGMRQGGREMDQTTSRGGATKPSKAPEYKMFRYVDLDVKPDQSYVYRIKVYLEDPNFPMSDANEPPESALEGSVVQRRKALKQKVTAGKKRATIANRSTDYSEESNVVAIKPGNRLLAGPVTPARSIAPRGEGMAIQRIGDEPTASAMALEFDLKRAADIPGLMTEVRRGEVANFVVEETEVLRPGLGKLEKIEDHAFRLDAMVLDIRGGNDHQFDELKAPGELLVMDSRGRLTVLNELVDADDFNGNIFPEETKNTPAGDRGFDRRGPGNGRGEGPPNFGRGGSDE